MSAWSPDDRRAAVGLAILATGFTLFFLFFFGVISRVTEGGGRTVRAAFESTGSLHKGEPVRIDGVNVGTVKKITVDEGGTGAMVEMKLKDDAGHLYNDAGASIKWRTLLGASFAVALDRGTPGRGDLGDAVIPASRTSYQVEFDDLTGAIRRNAQVGMQQMFHELPKTFSDPQEPSRLLDSISEAAPDIAAGFGALQGQRPDSDLSELVAYTGRAMQAINAPQSAIGALVRDAAITTQTTAARSQDLQETLSIAGRIMPGVRRTLTGLDGTVNLATPLLTRLKAPAGDVAPALQALHPVVTDANRLIADEAAPLLRSLAPTTASLATVGKVGTPMLDELSPSMERIDKNVLPDLAKKSPESQHTTYQMIGPAVAGLDGVGSHYDSEATYIRFTGSGGGRLFDQLPCRAFFTDPGSKHYLQCQAFAMMFTKALGKPPTLSKLKVAP